MTNTSSSNNEEKEKIYRDYSVLIVDDDENICKLLEVYLAKSVYNFNTKSFSKPNLALQLLKKKEFDAIIVDYHLDENYTGLDLIKQIRRINKYISILMLTGSSSRDIVIESMKLNVDDFLLKPVDFNNFSTILYKNIIKKKRSFHPNYRTISENNPITSKTNIPNLPKFNPFENFVIIYHNNPIFLKGNWFESHNTNNYTEKMLNDEQELVSGFIASLQSFSSSFFGQGSLIQELVLDDSKIIFSQIKSTTHNVISAIRLEKDNYHYLDYGNNRNLILNTLTKILEGIIEIADFHKNELQLILDNFLNKDDLELINYQLKITNSNLITNLG